MRKALRVSVYGFMPTPGGPPPMTVVTFEDNLIVTAEGLAAQMRVPGIFVVTEVFETDATDELEATFEAMERVDPEERNMAVMFWWTVSQLHNVSRVGAIIMPGPSPLDEDQTVEVFEQILAHPLYAEQRISTPVAGYERWVVLDEREIRTEDR